MRYHVETIISIHDQSFFRGLRRVLEKIDAPEKTSCHDLTEAIAIIFPVLKRCDGHLASRNVMYQHSWLLTQFNNIIDPYPIALIGGPILLDANGPWGDIYIRFPTFQWGVDSDRVEKLIQQIRLRM